jgi:hypothetical protein
MKKQCSKCFEDKDINDFNKKASRPDGLYNFCRVCQKIENKATYEKQKESRLIRAKQYYDQNKEIIAEKNELNKESRNAYNKQWTKKNKEYNKIRNIEWRRLNFDRKNVYKKEYNNKNREKINLAGKAWLDKNPLAKIAKSFRNRIWEILKKNKYAKKASILKYLGCSLNEFKLYIESQFKEGMNWENQGEWHLDHIIPCASAATQEQIYKLFHYTNFQPLWAKENITKNDKLKYEVKAISKEDTFPFLLNVHYAKRIPSIIHSFGLFANNQLVGVITYGQPGSPSVAKALVYDTIIPIIELNRLCLKNNLKNEASILISKSLKLLPKGLIVLSFADSSQGHVGYVYQATNFRYYGMTKATSEIALKSDPGAHSLSLYDQSKGQVNRIEFLRQKFGDDLYWRKRAQKHRYVFITGTNKSLYSNIKYKELKYPKVK